MGFLTKSTLKFEILIGFDRTCNLEDSYANICSSRTKVAKYCERADPVYLFCFVDPFRASSRILHGSHLISPRLPFPLRGARRTAYTFCKRCISSVGIPWLSTWKTPHSSLAFTTALTTSSWSGLLRSTTGTFEDGTPWSLLSTMLSWISW